MKESDRKLLTEFLGECHHPDEDVTKGAVVPLLYCRKCKTFSPKHRTFDTWQDLGDLKGKLVEKEEWKDFIPFAWHKFNGLVMGSFTDWLLNPERFCQLVVDFLKVNP